MKPIRIDKKINAPASAVFETVAHVENFRQAVDDIVDVQFVSAQRRGAGTTFRETRQMGKRKATVEMTVSEYAPPHSLRIVSSPDQMGTVWDSEFTIRPDGEGVTLVVEMSANSKNFLSRAMNMLFAGMIRKAVDKDMEGLKRFCEKRKP